MDRRSVLGLGALLGLSGALCGRAVSETAKTFTVTIDGVSYTIPQMAFNPPPPPSNPFFYQYEFMYIRIRDRELFINDRSRYKAQSGDTITITYIPNVVTVNGKPLPE